MTTDISFTPSSFYNFETSSSSSHISSSFTDHSYELQPRQMRNLESLLIILDSCENFKELIGLLDRRMAFQKMMMIDHLHSTIQQMEYEIWKQKSKAAMLFNDILTMKKSRRLQMHFQKNHSGWARQASPKPLPVLPPFQSPSPPPPPPIPIPGTPENPIDVDAGTRESLIEIQDNPEPVTKQKDNESDKEFPFRGRASPSVVNDWEGRVNWSATRRCENCRSISHGTRWCWEGLTFNLETGFWYTDKSREIWPSEGAVLWFHQLSSSFPFFLCLTHLFFIVSLLFHIDRFTLTDAVPWWLCSSTYSIVLINYTQLVGNTTASSQPCSVQPFIYFYYLNP